MERILSVDLRLDEHFPEPWTPNNSPLLKPVILELAPEEPPYVHWPLLEELDRSSDDTMYRSALDMSAVDDDDTDSVLEVPDCDLDFSLEEDVSKPDDTSIIMQW